MAIKPLIPKKIDPEDERFKTYIKDSAPVLEDVLVQERRQLEKEKKELEELKRKEDARKKNEELQEEEESHTMISMRIQKKLLKAIDKDAKKKYMKRSTWFKEAAREKLDRTIINDSKLDRIKKSGLIGCLNDTDIYSKNYKGEFNDL